jgi:hypothetical protein
MGKCLGKNIIKAASKRGINPYLTPFQPKDLNLNAGSYGSFSDWCAAKTTESGKWNKKVCLTVARWNKHYTRPTHYLLLPKSKWQC